MAQALQDNFRILTINVDDADFPPISEQQQAARSLQKRYPGRVAYAATFSVESFQTPGWGGATREQIQAALAEGAVGVKIWKNIGMELRNPDGSYVMPDDARLEPIIAELERDHAVLLGHQAEPLNCWLPYAKMTVRSDRDYFREHPQYYMYQHPQMPSHDAILAARDRLLSAHPALRFDAVHLASLEWDVDRVAAFLDRFPNASVDVAARMVHLQYQAAANRGKVRAVPAALPGSHPVRERHRLRSRGLRCRCAKRGAFRLARGLAIPGDRRRDALERLQRVFPRPAPAPGRHRQALPAQCAGAVCDGLEPGSIARFSGRSRNARSLTRPVGTVAASNPSPTPPGKSGASPPPSLCQARRAPARVSDV